ncbi:MAG: Aldose 1-epimerase family protein [Candidatus Nomurabacteria bacterium GW2011_GWF2_35_66]|uniref:Aldose 1-epimerase family protein n=1 Tax=Candidatus Nomurabacteria bacterium GW2011_GWE1_35_16 TaxID=1618761 RepID=A0A0G0B9I4_9BACT|nr:MAG: Aldose 1-epimerase family protein [Candidatus Nomurabacteria bacterium GW2011_GWF1_34_20]KKP62083.1 MAG: Aldose 1-epimerase family protein [Candidatus Nomurabacteria bacterium GW2011_GWE2_34_25]KKP66049.1 MAG: Aldose 1-epimerase family protein [Candidatus Nomurabacteria bacterium GW2011_GWE1_35_16]KKP83045.1 MAG: Aldose 1-epimerase family protein [Candidatus Nomurabacteria bacterium GW2011_GWF2_35_66]HAE36957.1 hypothetical protein [Candidatus Nomurabacteria bacterium]
MKENSSFEKTHELKIETIKGPNGCEVSFCPLRGGIITSLKLNGKELLFLDKETFKNKEVSVKGGIPYLFPNAGPLDPNTKFPNLAQHGFARNLEWKNENTENGFCITLVSSEETKKLYPYNFKFSIKGSFNEDSSFTMETEIENLEENEDMPISMGLHPYFNVSNEEKKNIKFNFEGGKYVEEQIESWANGKAISIENPGVPIEVEIPGLGTSVIDLSKEFKRIWVWSMSGKDFVCIEPVMRDKNGLLNNPELIKPKDTFKASVNFKLD